MYQDYKYRIRTNKMKNIGILLCTLILATSCSQGPEKPKITISNYTTQAITAKGVVSKLMNEPDYKKMHQIALAVESSRAISCVSVSEECNLLGLILNKIVNATQSGPPSEADSIAIYKMINDLDKEIKIGQEKLALEWGEYIKAHSEDQK
jgi:hypothetical protein